MNINFNTPYQSSVMPSICAGPFTVSFSARSVECNSEYELLLCAQNSNSYSHFSVANEDRLYLLPRWRFLDTNANIISSIAITGIESTVDGVTGSASFWYVDDMPSSGINISVEVNNILNYPVSSCNVSSLTEASTSTIYMTLSVGEWVPQYLKYTSDGISDIGTKWTEHPIKWYATLHQELTSPIIFSQSFYLTSSLVGLSSEFCPSTAFVEAFDKNGNYGWISGTAITNTSAETVSITGNVSKYTSTDLPYVFGAGTSGLSSINVNGFYYASGTRIVNGFEFIDYYKIGDPSITIKVVSATPPEHYWVISSPAGDVYKGYTPLAFPINFDAISYIIADVGVEPVPTVTYTYLLTGTSTSNEFKIRPFEQPFEIRRQNESWDATQSIKSYAMAPHLNSKHNLWDNFVGHSIGQVTEGQQLGRKSYERIANFPANHIDIDESNIKQLYSLSQYLDVPIDNYDLNYPSELQRLIDIGSISHSKLWGEVVKCNLNITDNEICPRCGYKHSNLGDMIIDPFSYNVTAGIPFIQHDRFNTSTDGWTIEYPKYFYYVLNNTWILNDSTENKYWTSIAMTKNGQYQVACNYIYDQIWYSNDYGETWSVMNNSYTDNYISISISDNGQYQTAASYAYESYIYTSNDYGETWNKVEVDKRWWCVDMSANGQYQTAIINASNGRIWTSNNYGKTWVEDTSDPVNRFRRSISMSSTGQYQLAPVYGGLIWISDDYGQTWAASPTSPVYERWNSSAVSETGQYQTVVGDGVKIWTSNDYGQTWVESSNTSVLNWRCVAMSNTGQYQIACDYPDGYIWTSDNYGQTWTKDDTAPVNDWRFIAVNDDAHYKTAVIYDGKIWRNNAVILEQSFRNNNENLCTTLNPFIEAISSYPLTWLSANNLDLCGPYDYYEYVDGFPHLETCDPLETRYIQSAGVINRNDEYNTLDVVSISSIDDWFGDEGKLQEAIEYELLRGLQLNSQTCSVSS